MSGKPLIEHSANTLKYSGMFERVIFSTDSQEMIELAENVESIDESILRKPYWFKETRIAPSVPSVVRHLVEQQGEELYDSVTFICANVLFIRSSWVRVAMNVLFNYNYLDDFISQVTAEPNHFWIGVCRINPYGDMTPMIYTLPHSGIVVDIDYEWDLELARQISEQVEAGTIDLPLVEDVHEQVFADANHNHMRGITTKCK